MARAVDQAWSRLGGIDMLGPPIVWLASDEAAGVHDERIVAADFERWSRDRNGGR